MITIHILKNNLIEKISLDELNERKINEDSSNYKLWLDITDISKEECEKIEKIFEIHHLVTEDLLNINTRIKIEEFKNYLFFVFYSIDKSQNIHPVELDFILNDKLLITNHKKPLESFDLLKSNPEKLIKLLNRGTDFLFHYLIDKEIDDFYPVLEKINETIEEMEDESIDKPNKDLMGRILNLKRKVNKIKKITLAQREKFSYLTKNELPFISKKSLPYFRDVYDHIIRASDFADDSKEAITNTYEIYMTTLSNNMNEAMKVLSIFATISLPLAVISGIYGTNFDILPGAGFAQGFWMMILAMILLSSSMIIFFKKRGWF